MQLLPCPTSPKPQFLLSKSPHNGGVGLLSPGKLHLVSSIYCSVLSQRHERCTWLSVNRSISSLISTKAASLDGPQSYFRWIASGYYIIGHIFSSGLDKTVSCFSLTLWSYICDIGSLTLLFVAPSLSAVEAENDVLKALSQIIDPDFGTDIVSCGFVKDMNIDESSGKVSFRLELTTPACPVKDMFEKKANEVVAMLSWVRDVNVTMSAQPARPVFAEQVPMGLRTISNIVAVSSCKGGVGKSTVAVNLAFTLAGMGARVGIFDADVYGPSLPTMVSPENRLLEMNPEKKTIIPVDYLGVKLVSFGFAGEGRAIMRGPMVSGVINQLLTTTEWGELDYLVIDMPPGTGDIHLTLCQVVPLSAAVIVTTPQKLSFIDVAKGVRMFSKLKVPCVAVVENMCHFDADGKRHYPFGRGSGSQA
ncbi:hypothetical protein IFM89_035206 [Coptis chinensis]|uniref:MIP18 family-like domain-containing protein n=1 Tax=Coptis chinensis TaxID=261450 RepID=A0A835IIW0_9MAGN|nr:hypothetical protein IFM89_035206 [Coptis chinensis]